MHNADTDHEHDHEDDTDDDQHSATPVSGSAADVLNDDDVFGDEFGLIDDYTANDPSSQSVVIPIAGGTLRLGNTVTYQDTGSAEEDDVENGERNTANTSVNHETDRLDLYNNDKGTSGFQDYFQLSTTDPVTGLVTSIMASDNDSDQFTNTLMDRLIKRTGTDIGDGANSETGPAYTDNEGAGGTDNYDDQSHLQISIQGSPTPGVTIDFEEDLDEEDVGGDSEYDSLSGTTPQDDTETDTFNNHDHITETGGGHSKVTIDTSSDDGNGNSVTFHEVDNETNTIDEELDNEDDGEEDWNVANGSRKRGQVHY